MNILRSSAKVVGLIAGVGVVGVGAAACIYDVDAGERVVMFDRIKGVLPTPIGEGTHIRIPFMQYPKKMDIRTKTRNVTSSTGTQDLQKVTIKLRILSHPQIEHLSEIYRELGVDYDDRIFTSLTNEVLKVIVAKRNAEELLTCREQVYSGILNELRKRAKKYHIDVVDVSIIEMTFGNEYTKAIEQKVVAQQQAEMAKFIVQKSEQEKMANIIRSEGESQSALLVSNACAKAGRGYIEIRRINTATDVARILARSSSVTYLPGKGSNLLLNLPQA